MKNKKYMSRLLIIIILFTISACDSGGGDGQMSTQDAYAKFDQLTCPLDVGMLIDLFGVPDRNFDYGTSVFLSWGDPEKYSYSGGFYIEARLSPYSIDTVTISRSEKLDNGSMRTFLDYKQKRCN
jgi:hypothetical protein